MSLELRFHDEALAEIRSAAGWYDEKRPGLGNEFLEALDVRLKQLAASPNLGGRFPGADPRSPFRRDLARAVSVRHRLFGAPDAIRVLAVMHGKQRPGYWMRRLPP